MQFKSFSQKSEFTNSVVLTATADSYVASGTVDYIQVGNMVFFTASYTMSGGISNAVDLTTDGLMPIPVDAINVYFRDYINLDTYDSAVHAFGVGRTGVVKLKGPHTASTSYSCSGSYICA